MGCCQSAEPERDPLLNNDGNAGAAAPAPAKTSESAGYQTGAAGGGLFQQGAAPQVATMADDAKGDAVVGEEQPKGDDVDAASSAKPEDTKNSAVIDETQKKLIDLTGNEDEEDEAAAAEQAAPKLDGSIRVGAADTLAAVPKSPKKDQGPAGARGDDDDDDDLDLTGASVPVTREGDMARRMGSSLAADVRGVAAQHAPEAKEVVKPLGEVKAEEPKAEEPKAEEPKEEAKTEEAAAE